MIDDCNFFDQPVRNEVTCGKIRKNFTGQGGDYTNGCLIIHASNKPIHTLKLIVINNRYLMLIQNQHKLISQEI